VSYRGVMGDQQATSGGEPRPSYAVVWQRQGEEVASGGLRYEEHGLHFDGRQSAFDIAFASVLDLSIQRGRAERLRGLPVITLHLMDGETVRVASLEGIGALHELARRLQRASLRLSA
jgi:hypothetical protein